MTENEKLRALLAEARGWLFTIPWSGDESHKINEVRTRIDAALAEPVENAPPNTTEWACYNCGSMGDFSPIQYAAGDYDIECGNCGSKNTDEADNVIRRLVLDLDGARAERDEARAEAARWRDDGEGLLRYASEASVAFKRGAEAMREAAAQEADKTTPPKSIGRDHGRHHIAGAQHAARRIRALPIPEDKR